MRIQQIVINTHRKRKYMYGEVGSMSVHTSTYMCVL